MDLAKLKIVELKQLIKDNNIPCENTRKMKKTDLINIIKTSDFFNKSYNISQEQQLLNKLEVLENKQNEINNPKPKKPRKKKVEEPKVEEPKVEEPKVEEPKVEKVKKPRKKKVEEPKVIEQKVEEPKVEKVKKPRKKKVEEPKVVEDTPELTEEPYV